MPLPRAPRPRGLARAAASAVALVLAVTLPGCAAGEAAPADDRPVVLTTFTVLADIASAVAGEHLAVESITKVGAEIHGYEPTPGDIRRAARADLILDHGMNLEAWFAQFVDGLDVPHVVVSEGITPISISDDGHRDLPNPHTWMSPLNVMRYVDTMAAAFAELDPAHAADFAANAAAYTVELQAVHDELVAALDTLPATARALVTCEGAFSYLARDAGLTERYIWAVNAEQQATPRQIAGVIDFVTEQRVPAVFCESTVSNAPMLRVAEASGARYGGTLYVDSLSEPGGPVPSYLELLRYDFRTIIAALTGDAP